MNQLTVNTPKFKEIPPFVWDFKIYTDSKSVCLSAKEVKIDEQTGEKYCSNYITVSRDSKYFEKLPKKYKRLPFITMRDGQDDIIELLTVNKIIEEKPVYTFFAEYSKIEIFKLTEFIVNLID